MRALQLAAAAVLLGTAACDDLDVADPPRGLSFDLTAETTTGTVGQQLRFDFEASGEVLLGVVVDFGDGTADTVATHGAQSASGHVLHAFGAPGAFEVTGRVETQGGAQASDQVTVTVEPARAP